MLLLEKLKIAKQFFGLKNEKEFCDVPIKKSFEEKPCEKFNNECVYKDYNTDSENCPSCSVPLSDATSDQKGSQYRNYDNIKENIYEEISIFRKNSPAFDKYVIKQRNRKAFVYEDKCYIFPLPYVDNDIEDPIYSIPYSNKQFFYIE